MKRKIAIPVNEDGILESHFGHCKYFEIFETEGENVISEEKHAAPLHEPGALPLWLAKNGVTDVLAGGIGDRAMKILNHKNISIFKGSPVLPAKKLVEEFISGSLVFQPENCEHHHHEHNHEHHHNHNHNHNHHHHLH